MDMARPTQYTDLTQEELAIIQLEWRRRKRKRAESLLGYRRDPVGYFKEFFPGETYTDGQLEIARSVVDNPITGVQSANSTGKTWVAPRIIKWFLDCFGTELDETEQPSCEVYVGAAPPARNLQRVWSELEVLALKFPHLFANAPMAERLEEGPKCFCEAVPVPVNKRPERQAESWAGKHARYMLFILDEANGVPEPVWTAIRECMSAGIVTRLLFFYNPRLRDGPAYVRFNSGGCHAITLSALDHINVVTGQRVIPGAVTREVVVSMIDSHTRELQPNEPWDDELCFDMRPYLVGATSMRDNGDPIPPLPAAPRKIVNQDFSYMILARAPKIAANRLIPDDWIDQARGRYDLYVGAHGDTPPVGVRPIMGGDIAEENDLNARALRYGTYVPPIKVWTGVNVIAAGDSFVADYKLYACREAYMDGTGLGAGVAPYMRQLGCLAEGVKISRKPTRPYVEYVGGIRVEGSFNILRDQLHWSLREWLDPRNGAMLPPQPRLIEALRRLTYRKNPVSGNIEVLDKPSLKKMLRYSPDEMESLLMTFAPSSGGWALWVEHDQAGLAA